MFIKRNNIAVGHLFFCQELWYVAVVSYKPVFAKRVIDVICIIMSQHSLWWFDFPDLRERPRRVC